MRNKVFILSLFLIFTSICFAEKEYPVSKKNYDELHELSISFNIYVNDLNQEILDLASGDSRLETLINLQNWASQTGMWLFVLDDMLSMEFYHAQMNQLNSKAIAIIKKNIDVIKEHIDNAVEINNKYLSLLKDIFLIRQYERYVNYLLKIEKLLSGLKIELSGPFILKKDLSSSQD